jgi:hypothetical protein
MYDGNQLIRISSPQFLAWLYRGARWKPFNGGNPWWIRKPKVGPFEFIEASDRTIIWPQNVLKRLPVCLPFYFSAKRLFNALQNTL